MGEMEDAAVAADVEAPTPAPPAPPAVPFREVLRTADAWDVLLMVTGSICGAACGAVQPWCAKRASAALVVLALHGCAPRAAVASASGPRAAAPSCARRPAAASRPGKARGAAGGLGCAIEAPRGHSAPLHRRCATPRPRCDLPRACGTPWRLAPRRAASNRQPRTQERRSRLSPSFAFAFAQLYAHLRLARRHARLRNHHEREPAPRHPLVLLPRRWGAPATPPYAFSQVERCPRSRPARATQPRRPWPATSRLRAGSWPASGSPTASGAQRTQSAHSQPRPSPAQRADRPAVPRAGGSTSRRCCVRRWRFLTRTTRARCSRAW